MNTLSHCPVTVCAALLLAILLAPMLRAQETRGSIYGSVIDSTGSAVPGANVVVTNIETGAVSHIQTNDSSYYEALLLLPGGDDGSKAGLQPVKDHPGFSHRVLAFHTGSNRWEDAGAMEAAHVTTAISAWRGGFVIPSGEVRPGVRSPAVWFIQPGAKNQSPC